MMILLHLIAPPFYRILGKRTVGDGDLSEIYRFLFVDPLFSCETVHRPYLLHARVSCRA